MTLIFEILEITISNVLIKIGNKRFISAARDPGNKTISFSVSSTPNLFLISVSFFELYFGIKEIG